MGFETNLEYWKLPHFFSIVARQPEGRAMCRSEDVLRKRGMFRGEGVFRSVQE